MKRIIVVLFLLLTCSAFGASVMQTRSEQVTTLPFTANGAYQYQQIYGVCAGLSAGQVVQINAQAEVTSPYSYNIAIGHYINIVDYYWDGTNENYIGTEQASPAVQENVDPSTHHKIIVVAFADTVTYMPGANHRCYTLVGYAAASGGSGSIVVEQGYGFLQVLTVP